MFFLNVVVAVSAAPAAGTLPALRGVETVEPDAVAPDPRLVLQHQVQPVAGRSRNDAHGETAAGPPVDSAATASLDALHPACRAFTGSKKIHPINHLSSMVFSFVVLFSYNCKR